MAKIKKSTSTCQIKGEVEPAKSFWLSDGRVLKNLAELADALDSADLSVWNYHVTAEKNDFANWVEDVFGDKALGKALRGVKSAKTAAKKIRGKQVNPSFWSFL